MDINTEINETGFLTPEVLLRTADTAEAKGWDGVEIRFSIANLRKLAEKLEKAWQYDELD